MWRVRVALVAAAVLALGAAPGGQTADRQGAEYATAVQAYIAGHDAAKAVAPLTGWTPEQFAAAVEKFRAEPQPRLAAAAVLQVEIGYSLVVGAPAQAARHLELGHQLVRQLLATRHHVPPMSVEEAAAFAERWYVAAASTLLMVNESGRAEAFIDLGMSAAPRSLDLRLMKGIVDDLNALSLIPEEARTVAQRLAINRTRVQALMRARNRYADLVKEAPAFVKARIRLGRVLWMLDEYEASRLELEHAVDQARDPAHRYLASMFLGALYERTSDLAGARAAYEEALTVAPRSQAAAVALGHLEVLAGRPDRAQALARALLSAPAVADEWWSYKNGGFEIAALAWLRSRVWR